MSDDITLTFFGESVPVDSLDYIEELDLVEIIGKTPEESIFDRHEFQLPADDLPDEIVEMAKDGYVAD